MPAAARAASMLDARGPTTRMAVHRSRGVMVALATHTIAARSSHHARGSGVSPSASVSVTSAAGATTDHAPIGRPPARHHAVRPASGEADTHATAASAAAIQIAASSNRCRATASRARAASRSASNEASASASTLAPRGIAVIEATSIARSATNSSRRSGAAPWNRRSNHASRTRASATGPSSVPTSTPDRIHARRMPQPRSSSPSATLRAVASAHPPTQSMMGPLAMQGVQ